MNKELNAHFDRIEASFSALIESIRSYNPSVSAADDLLAADHELAQGLQKLARHQSNHRQLLQLRRTVDSLDIQIKSTVSRLATVRKNLQDTPWSEGCPDNAKRVPIEELLEYANGIARTSAPPNYRHQFVVPPRHDEVEGDRKVDENGGQDTEVNRDTEAEQGAPLSNGHLTKTEEDAEAVENKEEQEAWLDAARNEAFVPWPKEDMLRFGALANLQAMTERGEDPWTLLGAESMSRIEGDEAIKPLEETGNEVSESRNDNGVSRSGAARHGKPQQPQVTGFGLYNPDEDEDD